MSQSEDERVKKYAKDGAALELLAQAQAGWASWRLWEFVTGLSRKLRAGTGDGMEAMFRGRLRYQEN
ncbi:MAG: hypothetical protein ACLSEX_13515 [Blautia sp.]